MVDGSSIRWGTAIFVLALAVRVSLIFIMGSYQQPEGTEVINVAKALALKGEFADAYGPGTGPTAHTAPIYPFMLSLVFRVFGTGREGRIGQEILSATLSSLKCALLPVLGVALGLGARAGLGAALWAALLPINFNPETRGSFEGVLTSLSLVLICLYFARIWQRARFSPLEAIAGGACAGVALLNSPSVIPVLFLLFAIGGWLFREQPRVYLRYAALFSIMTSLILIPWAIRNQRALGSPILVRSNLGLELMLSNNDLSSAGYTENWDHGLLDRFHPFLNPEARAIEMRQGEVAFQRDRMNEARLWIFAHPQRFATLTAQRVVLFWFPRMARTPQTILIWLEALLGLTGYILLLRTESCSKWLVTALWLGYPVIYYFVQAYTRYRYPIEWSFVLLGAFAVSVLFTKLSSRPANGFS